MLHIDDEAKRLLRSGYLQTISLMVNTKNETFEIKESDIIAGSFSIDRYCVNNKIEIGNASAAQMEFTINNPMKYSQRTPESPITLVPGEWSDKQFEGAEIYAVLKIKKWDAYDWENAQLFEIPLGYFIVDNAPRPLESIRIQALDRMVKFDKQVDANLEIFPISVENLVRYACDICGVSCVTNLSDLPNSDYVVKTLDKDDLTWRNVIQACAAIMGTNALINSTGSLEFKWYSMTDVVIDKSVRYTHDMYENDIVITGVKYETDDAVYLNGTDEYCFDMSDNLLISDDIEGVLSQLGKVLNGFKYRVYSATVKPMPYLMPMDMITFVDKENHKHQTIVTNVNFTLNQNTVIAGKGDTNQKNGYASSSSFTKAQAEIIKKLQKSIDTKVVLSERQTLELNRLLSNALGLNCIEEVQPNGSTKYYFCDGNTLPGSSIIYTFNANGFAWTTDWNGGSPIWEYGMTRDGGAVFRYIQSAQISAEQIVSGILRLGGFNNDNGELWLYDRNNSLIGKWDNTGFRMLGVDGSYVLINTEEGFAGYNKLGEKIYWVSENEFHMKQAVVEEEITFSEKIRFLPVTITDENGKVINDGLGIVAV